jgi:cytosine/adenosine deaminase-related metal-dependent hydrolase
MLRLQDYGIEVGKPASFNIIDAPNVLEALSTQRRQTVRNQKRKSTGKNQNTKGTAVTCKDVD